MKPSFNKKDNRKPQKEKIYAVKEETQLLTFLFDILADKSKTTIKSLLAHRQIGVNGRPERQFDVPLKPGDSVSVYFDKNSMPFKHTMLRIVFEDEFLIIVDKMQGLLSMATDRIKEQTAYHILSEYVKRRNPRNRIFIVHRLDRETSGLMMFAKSQDVQDSLQSNWDEIVRERKYVAVVEGKPKKDSDRIVSYITENSAFNVHSTNSSDGKIAITNYKVLKSNKSCSLLELELETGRKNQIRVHMQELGTSIVGDKKYGARSNPINRLALHAFKLRFVHPMTHKDLNFETEIPKKFLFLAKQ